jgi:hypothetical protein
MYKAIYPPMLSRGGIITSTNRLLIYVNTYCELYNTHFQIKYKCIWKYMYNNYVSNRIQNKTNTFDFEKYLFNNVKHQFIVSIFNIIQLTKTLYKRKTCTKVK